MMNSKAFSGLCWKETRQLIPLIAMLAGVATLLLTLWSITSDDAHRVLAFGGKYIAILFPNLYAAGAGAILVGQEKENRTLWWNASMPIAPTAIIGSKFAVALLGWCFMWFVSLLLQPLLPYHPTAQELSATDVALMVGASLFVLAAGFYTAWRCQSTFISLLAIIPIAAVAYLLTQVAYFVHSASTGQGYISTSEMFPINLAIYLTLFGVMTWLAVGTAIRTLAPADANQRRSLASSFSKTGSVSSSTAIEQEPFRIPLSALIWQSIHQNRISWLFMTSLLIVGIVSLALLSQIAFNDTAQGQFWLTMGCVIGFGGVCWLGVAAFAGDASSKRMRFLADRGISPTMAWLSCHTIAASLFSMLLLAYGLFTLFGPTQNASNENTYPVLSMATVGLTILVAYGVSQWASQTLRIVAANFVIAPVLSIVTILWFGIAAAELRTSLAWLLLCSLVPYFSTWWSMRWHMEDHGPLRMLCVGLVVTVLIILLPITPSIHWVVTWPRVSTDRLVRELASMEEITIAQRTESMMYAASQSTPESGPANREEVEAFVETLSFYPKDLLRVGLNDTDVSIPLKVDQSILERALDRASYAVLKFEQEQRDGDDMESKALLQEWFKALTIITKRLRNSDRWTNQEAADAIEIWLVQTLAKDRIAKLRDEAELNPTLAMLADSTSRNQARRRAVIASWRDNVDRDAKGTQDWIVYDWANRLPEIPPALKRYVRNDASNRFAVIALEMIDAGESNRSTESYRRVLHEMVLGRRTAFDAGPYSDRIRVNSVHQAYSLQQTISYPANQWFAAWERIPQQWTVPSDSSR